MDITITVNEEAVEIIMIAMALGFTLGFIIVLIVEIHFWLSNRKEEKKPLPEGFTPYRKVTRKVRN